MALQGWNAWHHGSASSVTLGVSGLWSTATSTSRNRRAEKLSAEQVLRGRNHLPEWETVRLFWVPSGGRRRPTRHREPTRSGQCSDPGVKGVEGLKGFSASGFPPSLNSLHFSPREAVEKNYSHCSPLPEIPLGALDPEVEGLALNYPPVEGQTLHWRPSGQRTAPNRSCASD